METAFNITSKTAVWNQPCKSLPIKQHGDWPVPLLTLSSLLEVEEILYALLSPHMIGWQKTGSARWLSSSLWVCTTNFGYFNTCSFLYLISFVFLGRCTRAQSAMLLSHSPVTVLFSLCTVTLSIACAPINPSYSHMAPCQPTRSTLLPGDHRSLMSCLSNSRRSYLTILSYGGSSEFSHFQNNPRRVNIFFVWLVTKPNNLLEPRWKPEITSENLAAVRGILTSNVS